MRDKSTSYLAIDFSHIMCEVRDIESEWTMDESSITETAEKAIARRLSVSAMAVTTGHTAGHPLRRMPSGF